MIGLFKSLSKILCSTLAINKNIIIIFIIKDDI